MSAQPEAALKTPLHAFHLAKGARMAPFAGYEMPIQYPEGVLKEHLATRAGAGIFDVSHMGQIVIRPKDGQIETALAALEQATPADALGLKPGRQRYGLFTNREGGIEDDFMFANLGDHVFLVANAARKANDEAILRAALGDICTVEPIRDRALIALQGPKAAEILASFAPEASAMKFMDFRALPIMGAEALVSRSGYTGEDGYEISLPEALAEPFAAALLERGAHLAGLGARDSLRLEAGLCLYGADLDVKTTPVEAALEWALGKARRPGGAREGGYPGAEVIARQLAEGASRRRVGLKPEGRAPIRAGTRLFSGDEEVGVVTSGGFGPTLAGPMAMGYVRREALDKPLTAELRGQRAPLALADLPFVRQGYAR